MITLPPCPCTASPAVLMNWVPLLNGTGAAWAVPAADSGRRNPIHMATTNRRTACNALPIGAHPFTHSCSEYTQGVPESLQGQKKYPSTTTGNVKMKPDREGEQPGRIPCQRLADGLRRRSHIVVRVREKVLQGEGVKIGSRGVQQQELLNFIEGAGADLPGHSDE
ncbi:hypothetical protein [Streptomyces sp. NPDC057579]|uniref:hypothetical protein n=1 Tax=Streptomyces sp. NPDC057579 TaxID=3346172 RepID=UPI00369F3271